ncbi:hypothetical protein Moror_10931 [Moniliophthora roreri MCA 2997]|uniref:DUF6533 domain-containing protein n=1 Tax=Moniliophthora roreri (strain MCA 2997) TaxID=1381753 RepID=V2Y4W4_MONRO|nr:hypothetical protein Moror_10931 [Moniliophthora roreri MCA 2997]
MSPTIGIELLKSILEARFAIAASVICLLYDHLLTLDLEVANVWRNPEHKPLNKVSFAINRYLTEAVIICAAFVTGGGQSFDDESSPPFQSCKRFIWVFTISVTIIIGVSQFFINMRVYKTWETRASMNLISNCVFAVLIAAAAGLSVVGVIQAQAITHFLKFPGVCAFSDIPTALPIMLGLLAFFDFFLILLAMYNALEKPHQTNSDVLDSFLADGAKLFVVRSPLDDPDSGQVLTKIPSS